MRATVAAAGDGTEDGAGVESRARADGASAGTDELALDIAGLHKRFGDTVVLAGIDVSMAPGEFLVLVGPSGCGKSTLLNCIAGLEEVSEGRLAIGGRDVTRVPPRERDIAMVFQSYALYPTMSIADNIGFGMKVRRVPKRERESKINEVAELLQIGHLLERKPAQLSGGQRQRVAMGRALVRDPALFLFDEPLSNLDAKLRVEMRAEIKRVHQSTAASIVYVTHDQIEAMTLATRIVVLKGGVVQQVATPKAIYDAPANTFVADFMGSPPMNLVPARVEAGGEALLFEGERRLAVALPPGVRERQSVTLGIRPEAFSRHGGNGPTLSIEPTMIENSGADAYVSFTIGERVLTARLAGRFDGVIGDPVNLSIDTTRLCYFDNEDDTLIRR